MTTILNWLFCLTGQHVIVRNVAKNWAEDDWYCKHCRKGFGSLSATSPKDQS